MTNPYLQRPPRPNDKSNRPQQAGSGGGGRDRHRGGTGGGVAEMSLSPHRGYNILSILIPSLTKQPALWNICAGCGFPMALSRMEPEWIWCIRQKLEQIMGRVCKL